MADTFYLIRTRSTSSLDRVVTFIRSEVGVDEGDPVIPLGSQRVALYPEAAREIGLKCAPRKIEQALKAEGADTVTPITFDQLQSLIGSRDSIEIKLERVKPVGDLVVDGYDWHLAATRLPDAWTLLGGPSSIAWGNVRVGQIDTGYREHPALGFVAGVSGTVLTALDRNFFPGDFNDATASPDSGLDPLRGAAFDGHGTRTGSVLAGHDLSEVTGEYKGFFGAAPRVPYIPMRISDSVVISHVQKPLAEAIHYAVDQGCGVLTLSMGFPFILPFPPRMQVLPELRDAIDYAYENGSILVCAAGNVWRSVVAPAALRRTIAVGGSTPGDLAWNGSSRGPQVDVSAPAWPIRRASVDRKGRYIYGVGDGTSFAAAMVAGAAALWLRYNEQKLVATYPLKWQRVEAFKRVLRTTARQVPNWNTSIFGTGILDVHALLTAPLPDDLTKDDPA